MEGERQRWGSSALVWDLGAGDARYVVAWECMMEVEDVICETRFLKPPFLFQISLFKYASLRVLIVDRGGMLRD